MSAVTAKREKQPKERALRSMLCRKELQCTSCDRRFRTDQALAQHVAASHGQEARP